MVKEMLPYISVELRNYRVSNYSVSPLIPPPYVRIHEDYTTVQSRRYKVGCNQPDDDGG